MSDEVLYRAIRGVQSSLCAFCRYITGNDTGKTGSHQAGFYIPKEAARLLFEEPVTRGTNSEKYVDIKWQDDFVTKSRFIYYGRGTRNEFRITRFGRQFPFFEDDNVGDLLVLAKQAPSDYVGFVLSADEDIDGFLSYFNLSPEQTNQLIDLEQSISPSNKLNLLLDQFVSGYDSFPETVVMARGARDCYNRAFGIGEKQMGVKSDEIILKWLDAEYTLFQKMENKVYAPLLRNPFSDVKTFVESANQILNRRKSRAGKSLEHHLAKVFDMGGIVYEEQVITEERKKPDFIFPNGNCYHNFEFPADLLVSLAAKTTCKDRWRQIINEADRIDEKHLFTLQQAISKNQLEEMKNEHVRLVVPRKYIKSYPKEYQADIFDLSAFVGYVKGKQEHTPKHFLIKPT